MDLRPALLRAAAIGVFTITSFTISFRAEAAVDLYGVDEVTLSWEEASGPVIGYFVIVAPADEGPFVHGVVAGPSATVSVRPGDEFAVRVAAFDKSGVAGPLSPSSPTLRFHREAGGTTPPDGGDPPPDGGDPPPPDDGNPGPKGPGTAYDFEGDGASDLLVREPTGGVALWRMDGSSVRAAEAFPVDSNAAEIVGAGDYDGDGIADLLWEDLASGGLRVWLLRDGALREEVAVDTSGLAAGEAWRVGGSGDFDGDGHDDVVLFSRVVGASELLFLRDGATDSRMRLEAYAGAWSIDASDDFDGDGVDEILWRDEVRHELVLWDLNGDGSTPTFAAPVTGWRVAGTGDFDGDGRADLFAVREDPPSAQVWMSGGTQLASLLDLPTPSPGQVASHVGDFDADARADLVWSDPAGGIEIWFSDGAGVTRETVAGGSAGAVALLGEEGSDDTEFRARLCDADFDGDLDVDAHDYPHFAQCFGAPGSGDCSQADMDGDGLVGVSDFRIFKSLFAGAACGR